MRRRHAAAAGAMALALVLTGATTTLALELSPSEQKGLRKAVKAHIQEQLDEEDGAFVIRDDKLDKDWRAGLVRLHDEVRQASENVYALCADFKESDGGTKLDVDFLVNRSASGWTVRQAVLHKVGGKPRVALATAAPPLKKAEPGGAVYFCHMGDYTGPRTPNGRCPKCGMNLMEKK